MEAYLKNFEHYLLTESGKQMYKAILETTSFEWLMPHEKRGYHNGN